MSSCPSLPAVSTTCPVSGGGVNANAIRAGSASAPRTSRRSARAKRLGRRSTLDLDCAGVRIGVLRSERDGRRDLGFGRRREVDARLERLARDLVHDLPADAQELGVVVARSGVVLLARAEDP